MVAVPAGLSGNFETHKEADMHNLNISGCETVSRKDVLKARVVTFGYNAEVGFWGHRGKDHSSRERRLIKPVRPA